MVNDTGEKIYYLLIQNLAICDSKKLTVCAIKIQNVPCGYSNPVVPPDTLNTSTCFKCELMFGGINGKEAHQKVCLKKKGNRIKNQETTKILLTPMKIYKSTNSTHSK